MHIQEWNIGPPFKQIYNIRSKKKLMKNEEHACLEAKHQKKIKSLDKVSLPHSILVLVVFKNSLPNKIGMLVFKGSHSISRI